MDALLLLSIRAQIYNFSKEKPFYFSQYRLKIKKAAGGCLYQ